MKIVQDGDEFHVVKPDEDDLCEMCGLPGVLQVYDDPLRAMRERDELLDQIEDLVTIERWSEKSWQTRWRVLAGILKRIHDYE